MKKKLSIILTALILLTSCSHEVNINNDTTEKVSFLRGSHFSVGNQYLLKNMDLLQYIDLTSGDMSWNPLCSKPNCRHDDDSCAAFMLRMVMNPFIYKDKLYYFMWYGNDVGVEDGLYQADTDGTNQKLIFKPEENEFIYNAWFFNGNLVFAYRKKEHSDILYGDLSHLGHTYRFYIYNFESVTLFYETGLIYNEEFFFHGIIGNDVYFDYRARDSYFDVPFGQFYEYIEDKNSEYWQGMVSERRIMPLGQKDPANPKYETVKEDWFFGVLVISGDSYYYFNEDMEFYSVNTRTNKKALISPPHDTYADILQVFDGKVFVMTFDKNNDYFGSYYYENDEFVKIEENDYFFLIIFETEDYFFGYFSTSPTEVIYGYFSKTDYYSGNWDGLIEFEW